MIISDGKFYLSRNHLVVEVMYDEYGESPRCEDAENLGRLFVRNDSPLGRNETAFTSWDDLLGFYGVETDKTSFEADVKRLTEVARKRGNLIIPVSTYSHGGTTVFEGLPGYNSWDSSFEGFLIASRDLILDWYHGEPDALARAEAELKMEIQQLDAWLQSQVYRCVVYDIHAQEIDDLCSVFGDDSATNGLDMAVGGELEAELTGDTLEEAFEKSQDLLGIVVDPAPSLSERIHIYREPVLQERDHMIKFKAYIDLVDALCKNNLLGRDPGDPNRVLVRHTSVPDDTWASMNVFDVAQELYDSKEQRDSLFHALREQGKEPVFSDEGDFCGLHDVL